MNDHNMRDLVNNDEAKASDMAVNFVHYDDQDKVESTETVPLAYYMQGFGLTSEAFIAQRQKRARRNR